MTFYARAVIAAGAIVLAVLILRFLRRKPRVYYSTSCDEDYGYLG